MCDVRRTALLGLLSTQTCMCEPTMSRVAECTGVAGPMPHPLVPATRFIKHVRVAKLALHTAEA